MQRRGGGSRVMSVAVEDHAAGVGRDRAGHDAEQRGLAGAVRPDDAERLALLEREIEPVGDDDGAEALGDFFEGEDEASGYLLRRHCRAMTRHPVGTHRCSGCAGVEPAHHSLRGDDESASSRDYDANPAAPACRRPECSAPGLLAVMTSSKSLPLRCHWPATSGVLVTFFTGWPVHFTGPTIEL